MRPRRLVPALLSLVLAAALPLGAQAPGATPSHRAAIARLLEVSQARETSERSTEMMLASLGRQLPQAASLAGVMRDFYREELSWTVLEPELTRMYLEVFTEPEVRQLVQLYESPAGKLLLERMPQIMTKTQEITSRRVQAAMPRMMERMQAALQAQRSAPAEAGRPPLR